MGVFYPHPPFSLFISTISDVKKSVIHILIHIIPITPFPHLNYFHIYGYSSADFEQSGAGLLSYGQACRARMRVRQDIVLTIPATEQEQAGHSTAHTRRKTGAGRTLPEFTASRGRTGYFPCLPARLLSHRGMACLKPQEPSFTLAFPRISLA